MASPSSKSPYNSSTETTAGPNLSTTFVHIPPTFLDAIIPGYSVIAKVFLTSFGIDVSFYVSLAALTFVVLTALRMVWEPVFDFCSSFAISTVVIEEYDNIWDDMLRFCAAHPSLQNLREVRGKSQATYGDEDSDDEDGIDGRNMDTNLPEDSIFNFNDWAARVPPRFEPHESSGFFWHNGYAFRILRSNEQVRSEWSATVRDREKLLIQVIWRNVKPIKDVIEEARELSLSKKVTTTTIRRPTPRLERGRRNAWQTVARRPSRPMATVVLDHEQKVRVLEDINEFLHPKTARWYSNRGIPYRRGYLFHGAPGTGKSSLSFALAGVFGLDIYCLSLSEVTLTEEDMMMLFNSLPKRCVVLLEDIDCAGISRPKPIDNEKKKKRRERKSRKTHNISATTSGSDETPPISRAPTRLTNAITISGLLNAIDGVASAEGRILLMTSNYPDKLDEALVRPGRVDLQVEFKLASRTQIRELFLRMYCADDRTAVKTPTKLAQVLPQLQGSTVSQDVVGLKDCGRSIEALADEFAAALPVEQFSPAEIQGFMLTRKRNPLQAVNEVANWCKEQIEKKKAKQEGRRFKDVGDENEATRQENERNITGSETDDAADESSGSSSD